MVERSVCNPRSKLANAAATLALASALILSCGAARSPVAYVDYATAFDRFEATTRNMAPQARIAAFRDTFERTVPGLYVDSDAAELDRRIGAALAAFPALRPKYRALQRRFPAELAAAVTRFRRIFPGFVPPIPIYLLHSLGIRDGGTDDVNGRKVMMFGADVIATAHDDTPLQPFLDHELFHLEHGRHFADCDQFWCPLWQEGMATYAASVMTPGASDHQLMLDVPGPIRAETDRRWGEALCETARAFDSSDTKAVVNAFMAGHPARSALPSRYGYYVGLRIVSQAARMRTLQALARLEDAAARPVAVAALGALIAQAHAPCRPPPDTAPITQVAPRPA